MWHFCCIIASMSVVYIVIYSYTLKCVGWSSTYDCYAHKKTTIYTTEICLALKMGQIMSERGLNQNGSRDLDYAVVNFQTWTWLTIGQVVKDATATTLQIGIECESLATCIWCNVFWIWSKHQCSFLDTGKSWSGFNTFTKIKYMYLLLWGYCSVTLQHSYRNGACDHNAAEQIKLPHLTCFGRDITAPPNLLPKNKTASLDQLRNWYNGMTWCQKEHIWLLL